MNFKKLSSMMFLMALSFTAQAENWRSFRGSPSNSGASSVSTKIFTKNQHVRAPKTITLGGLIWATSVTDQEGNFYVGSSNKNFYSFKPNGELRWTYTIFDLADSLIDSAAVVTPNGLVVIPGGDGFLHAVHKDSGKMAWTFKAHHADDDSHQKGGTVNSFEGNVQLGPNGFLYAGSDNGAMYCLDQEGKEKWSLQTDMMIWSSPAFSPDGQWLTFGSLDGHLYLVEPDTGKLLHKYKIGKDIKSSPSVDELGNIYVGASDSALWSFKVVNGELKKRWNFTNPMGEIYSSPAVKGDNIVFGSLDGSIYNISRKGELNWKYTTYSAVASSPTISTDDVVYIGAKNGKMYALNLKTGKRIWSYITQKSQKKSNLDASVLLMNNGVLVNGSYKGKLYLIPSEYCLLNKEDSNCQFGGNIDEPDFGIPVEDNEATLRYFSNNGTYHKEVPGTIGTSRGLVYRLVVKKEGIFLPRRAVDSSSLKIKITPQVEVSAEVSSDGKFINLFPKTFFEPNTTYTIEIKGRHYKQKTWLKDRWAWFGREAFRSESTFTTDSNNEINDLTKPEMKGRSFDVDSLYLLQPMALDTYIPAAMDGQGFKVTVFGNDIKKNQFLLYALPGIQRKSGMGIMPEKTKVFTMKGTTNGQDFKAEGAFTIAAMGGEIPFNKMIFAGTSSNMKINHGEFYATAACYKIKGNDSSYSFPYELINQVCDNFLRMKGLGEFKSRWTPEVDPNVSIEASLVDFQLKKRKMQLSLTLEGTHNLGDHLLGFVFYDPDTMEILNKNVSTYNLKDKRSFEASLNIPRKVLKKKARMAIFLDSKLLFEGKIPR
ncbi:PQQ-binding-like beta-propeller repeat protein [Bacteriovoracales bacterium]|nr:PQQ-binding-like beta-propeller repeat protein [Bacteriovoracales bacterium]